MRLAVSCAWAFAAACAHGGAPSTADEPAIARELDDFHDAAASADEQRYFAHFAPDGVFLGTDATERWEVPAFRAYAHPHFAQGKAWSFRGVRRRIAVRGDIAWFEEDLDTRNLGPARGSGVLVRKGPRWLIEQYVLSITVPNERFKDVRELLTSPSRASP
jgi:ketosteroid isomerase-like protein